MPQSAISRSEINANRQVINHFKYYVCKARENKQLSFQSLIACINQTSNTENIISPTLKAPTLGVGA